MQEIIHYSGHKDNCQTNTHKQWDEQLEINIPDAFSNPIEITLDKMGNKSEIYAADRVNQPFINTGD